MYRIRIIRAARFVAVLSVATALAALTGCPESNKSTITGKVTFNGAPLPGGEIKLTPKDPKGTAPIIPIKADGTFNDTTVPPGDYEVAVDQNNVGATPPTPPAGATAAGSNTPTSDMKKVDLPAKVSDPKQSGITWTVKTGKQDLSIDLDKYK